MNEHDETILTPPSNLDAERSVLGSCLVDREALESCEGILHPAHFYREPHGHIYKAMQTLVAAREPVDLITLSDELRRSGLLDAIGGIGYLAQLADEIPTTANAEYYAKIVKELSMLRRMADECRRGAERCYTSGADPAEVIGSIEASILSVAEHRATNAVPLSVATAEANDRIDRGAVGLRFHIQSLTRATGGGMRQGEYTLLLAYRKQGKTRFMARMAYEHARDMIPCLLFSLEMSRAQLGAMFLAWECGTTLEGLTFLDREDRMAAMRRLDALPILIEHDQSITIAQMRAVARRAKKRNGIQWVGIDYAGKLHPDGLGRGVNSVERLDAAADQVKAMARELDLPILMLHQLTRERVGGRVVVRGNGTEEVHAKGSMHLEEEAESILVFSRPAAEIDPNTVDLAELNKLQEWGGKAIVQMEAVRNHHEQGQARIIGWHPTQGYPYELAENMAPPRIPVQTEYEYGDPLAGED